MRLLLEACCILVASATIQSTVPPQKNATGSIGDVSRSVTDLATALLNGTSVDAQSLSIGRPYVPRQLLIKFKEHGGGSSSSVADLVNNMAGIDLIRVIAVASSRLPCAASHNGAENRLYSVGTACRSWRGRVLPLSM